MDLSNATRVANFGSGIGTEGAIIKVDDDNQRIGIGTNNPQATLQVGTGVSFYGNSGIVSATAFYGDGSNITNAGSTLDASSGVERVVVTSQTSGNMTAVATDADLYFDTPNNTLSAKNVSIAGTLTYEDVTNIDSLGIVTARTGVKVTAGGINAVGVVTATSFSGDGSTLSGVEFGAVNFVASGTISNGATVIIKDDGTVGIVTSTGNPASFGNEEVFEDNDCGAGECSVVHDTVNNKIVVSYTDKGDSYKGKAVVGTISGTSITFGTPVEFNSAVMSNHSAYVGSGKVVIAYQHSHSSYWSYAIVGTVSGTSISFGSEANFNAGYGNNPYVVYDSGNDKVVILFKDGNDGNYGKAIVGTVSGTSISFGSEFKFNGNDTALYYSAAYIGNSKIVIAYTDEGSSPQYKGTAVVGTVSGTSISFGTKVVFNDYTTGRTSYSPCISVGNDKVVIAYQADWSTSGGINDAIVGTVSGTDISFGSATTFMSGGEAYFISGIYDTVGDKVFMAYRDDSNSQYGTSIIGTVSGTSISFDSSVVFATARSDNMSVGYDSTNDKAVIAYADYGNSAYGTAIVYSFSTFATNLTSENYIGIAGEAIANGATGKVNVVGGVNSSQSGLTTAQTYYVGQTGILTTTADTPSVVAGTSISGTKISVR